MSSNRKTWTTEEDTLLSSLVSEIGVNKWGYISRCLKSIANFNKRTGKQCRERWHNHLDPSIKKEAWTTDEKLKILELHKIHGNRWSKISQYFSGRTDNAIKNFYYSNLRKKIRNCAKLKKKSKKTERKNSDGIFENSSETDTCENHDYHIKTLIEEKMSEVDLDIEASRILYSLSRNTSREKKQRYDIEPPLDDNSIMPVISPRYADVSFTVNPYFISHPSTSNEGYFNI